MNTDSETTDPLGGVRRHGPGIGAELVFNFVLPFVVYDLGTDSLGKVGALMASSVPPILWAVYGFIRDRRIDAISILVVSGILLSLLAFVGGGGVKFLQLRENLVTGLVGFVFLASAAIGRPLIYQLARAGIRRRSSAELEAFEAHKDDVHFRRNMKLMTLVWGGGLLASCAVNCVLVFSVSIKEYLLISPPIGYVTMGLLIGWNIWFLKRARRRIEELRQTQQDAPVED